MLTSLFLNHVSVAVVSQSERRCPGAADHSSGLFGSYLHAGSRSVCLTYEVHCRQLHCKRSADERQSELQLNLNCALSLVSKWCLIFVVPLFTSSLWAVRTADCGLLMMKFPLKFWQRYF